MATARAHTTQPTQSHVAPARAVGRTCACGQHTAAGSTCPACRTHGSLGRAAATGRPLPGDVRSDFESRFDAPLADVRLHDGPAARRVARAHDAAAVTDGADIFFGRGRLQPDDPAGRQLLTHEVAHVLQGRNAGPASPVSALEREAEALSRPGDTPARVRGHARHVGRPLLQQQTQTPEARIRAIFEDELDDIFFGIDNAWPAIRAAPQPDRDAVRRDNSLRIRLQDRADPKELLRTYLLLAFGNESAFPAHFQAILDATERWGTHEARIYAVLRGVNEVERAEMRDMPGLRLVLREELGDSDFLLADRLLSEQTAHADSATAGVQTSTHLEVGERSRLDIQATGSFERAQYNIEQALQDDGNERSQVLLNDTSLWARFADKLDTEEVWFLRMITRYTRETAFPRIAGQAQSFIRSIWDAVKGWGTKEEELVNTLSSVAQATTATSSGPTPLVNPPRSELVADPWFVPMLESELSGNELTSALNAISVGRTRKVGIRDQLEDAIDDHDMLRIRGLLRAPTLSAADRDTLRNDPVILDEIGEELSGWQLAETGLLLRYGAASFPAHASTLLGFFQTSPINVSGAVSFLEGLDNDQQTALRAEPGLFFMLTSAGLSADDQGRVLAAIRSSDPGRSWNEPGSVGFYRTSRERMETTLPVQFTASEARISMRCSIDTRGLTGSDRVGSGMIEDWIRVIDEHWNGKFRLRSGTTTLALVIVPYIAHNITRPHVTIFANSRKGRASAIEPTTGGPGEVQIFINEDKDITIAHEFGHILGNPDEYDLIPASFLARTGTPAKAPPQRGGQTAPGMMGNQYDDPTIHQRYFNPVLEIVNATRDPAVFPDRFTLERT